MDCSASPTPSVQISSAIMLAVSSPKTSRNGLQLLLDLPQEVLDLILREAPLASQIALSITCRTARQVFLSLHRHDKTWASRSTLFNAPSLTNAVPFRDFLIVLERDLADRYFHCRQCVLLHPFYDLATETSPAAISRRLTQFHPCPVKRPDSKPWEAFATRTEKEAASDQMGRFSISIRQLRLLEHYLQYGHGIPMSHFCREIAPASLSLASSPSTTATITTEPAPRWRQTINLGIQDNENFFVRELHELVYEVNDKEAVRRYLDQTPHALCPHLVTHDNKDSLPLGPLNPRYVGPNPATPLWNRLLPIVNELVCLHTEEERRGRGPRPALRCKGIEFDPDKQRCDPVTDLIMTSSTSTRAMCGSLRLAVPL
ncbi:hypothetical protein PG984_015287 [Apiospora sp. TS-2023a]